MADIYSELKNSDAGFTEDQIDIVMDLINKLREDEAGYTASNIFDKACDEVDDAYYTGDNTQENAIEFVKNSPTATVTFSQGRYISKIKKLLAQYPEDVKLVCENTDGSIVAHIPVSYIKINGHKRELTEDKRNAARERMLKYHANKNIEATDI